MVHQVTSDQILSIGMYNRLLALIAWVALPFMYEFGLGFSVSVIALMGWQWCIVYGKVARPNSIIKTVLVALVAYWLFVRFPQWRSLDFTAALLVYMTVAKLLESKRRRDAHLIILLCYFIVFVAILFSQLFTVTLWAFLTIIGLLLAQITLLTKSASAQLKPVIQTVLISLPLTLVMLTVMPRVGAFWSIKLDRTAGVIGLSDELRLGAILSLSEHDSTAFRVKVLSGHFPAPADRYWRAKVLDQFDGERWFSGSTPTMIQPSKAHSEEGDRFEIQVMPSGKNWLFTLASAAIGGKATRTTAAGELRSSRIINTVHRYTLFSGQSSMAHWQPKDLQLPDISFATKRWAKQYEADEPERFIRRVLKKFNNRFVYTLSPPHYPARYTDAFFLQDQAGFCGHFASTLAVLLRAHGVPARVVLGYLGGEYIASDDYWRISQRDAHAWVEAWVGGRWINVDPTAAVAPERIQYGLNQIDTSQWSAQQGFSWGRLVSGGVLRRAWLQFDAFNYRWANWIDQIDTQRISQPDQTLIRYLWGIGIALALVPIVWLGRRLWAWWRQPVEWRRLKMGLWKLEREGVIKAEGETLRQFLARLEPLQKEKMQPLVAAFERYEYMR